jgi:DNA-binding transcriptional regulator YiaG
MPSMTPESLRTARQQLGLTQAWLAAELGVGRIAVTNWERGARPVPPWLPLAIDGLRARRSSAA